MTSDAEKRTERISHPDRPRNPDGPVVPQLLGAGAAGERTTRERMPAGAGQAALGTAHRLARHARALFAHRRVLRAPGDIVVGWAQRREWIALPLPRLEIR